MTEFTVSDAAIEELRRITRRSRCVDPVLTLADSTSPIEIDAAARQAFLGATEIDRHSTIASIVQGFDPKAIDWQVEAGAFEKSECCELDLLHFEDVTLALSPKMRVALRDCILDVQSGKFVFRKGEETISSLYRLAANTR